MTSTGPVRYNPEQRGKRTEFCPRIHGRWTMRRFTSVSKVVSTIVRLWLISIRKNKCPLRRVCKGKTLEVRGKLLLCIFNKHMNSTWKNVPSNMCAQWKFRSGCAFAQSDQNLLWAHFWLASQGCKVFFMRTTKNLISRRGCVADFESSLDAHVWRYVFSRYGSIHFGYSGPRLAVCTISEYVNIYRKYWGSLTLVLLNPDMPSFTNNVDPDQLASDLDLHCLTLSAWLYFNNLDQVIWLAKN